MFYICNCIIVILYIPRHVVRVNKSYLILSRIRLSKHKSVHIHVCCHGRDQYFMLRVCVCVRACVRACVQVCGRAGEAGCVKRVVRTFPSTSLRRLAITSVPFEHRCLPSAIVLLRHVVIWCQVLCRTAIGVD